MANAANVNANNNASATTTMTATAVEYKGPLSQVIMNGDDVTSLVTEDGKFQLEALTGNQYRLTGNFTIGHPFDLDAIVSIESGVLTFVSGAGTVTLPGMGLTDYEVSSLTGSLLGGTLALDMAAAIPEYSITASFHFSGK